MITSLGAYYRPDRLEDALALLASDPHCEVLAGGTDLLVPRESRTSLADLAALGLDGLEERAEEALVLGAMLRVQAMLESPLAARWADGVLVGACLEFGTLAVRNMATVGGNVAHALPAADLVPALLALDAEVECARAATPGDTRSGAAADATSAAGSADAVVRRRLPLDGFATGPFRTVLQPGEMIVALHVPWRTRGWRAQFRKLGRVMKDLAQANCAVGLGFGPGGEVLEARIVLGAVHPTVVRVRAAEAELAGADPAAGDWSLRVRRAVEAVRGFVQPITDVRATREWRRHVSGILVERCLAHCADPQSAGQAPRLEDGPTYCAGLQA